MARFYRVTELHSKREADQLASRLSKHLKQEGFPSTTTVETEKRGEYTVYVVFSTATPKQMDMFHHVINAEPIRFASKKHEDIDDPGFRKVVVRASKSYNADMKKDLAMRKKHQTEKRR
jgi:hypothetical protein